MNDLQAAIFGYLLVPPPENPGYGQTISAYSPLNTTELIIK